MAGNDGAPAWAAAARRAARAKVLHLHSRMPDAFLNGVAHGRYQEEPIWYWTSGFWPGLMRLVLNDHDDPAVAESARRAEDRLFALIDHDHFLELHHDVGFQFVPTTVMRYRQTGDPDARRRGIVAAHLLLGRFNVAGGVIEAWNGDAKRGYAIVDTLMNLSLLFWATAETGEPRFANAARVHIATVEREFIRDDYSTHHIVEFDQHSGDRRAFHGGQAIRTDSAWSRGNAWAIYGLAIAARYTGSGHYASLSRNVADTFLAMNESHGVPPWDFRADDAATSARDSSAAAIAVCGLLELAAGGDSSAGAQAESLLRQLVDQAATLEDNGTDGLLGHATSNFQQRAYVESSLIYGDYFFYEALARLTGDGPVCW